MQGWKSQNGSSSCVSIVCIAAAAAVSFVKGIAGIPAKTILALQCTQQQQEQSCVQMHCTLLLVVADADSVSCKHKMGHV